ncbi:MAG: competence/damage-inducible protein A [Calditrichaeota bacterium]|nr:competence/damage-inducible protein A [Calditrichota bacterium]
MKAILISIGNELLSGKTVNTNATYISSKLHELGIETLRVVTIGDDAAEIQQQLQLALQQADVIITTGGLGPTHDDITKKAIVEFLGSHLIFKEEILHKIEERFRRRGSQMPAINRNQAMVPADAELIDNPVGTAPGLLFRRDGKMIFVLPGVPREMKAMMEDFILPLLKDQGKLEPIHVFQYRTTGIAESRIYEICHDLFEAHPQLEVAFLPRFIGVDIRILVKDSALQQMDYSRFERELYGRIGKYIYTTGTEELEAVVGRLLKEKGWTIAVAESCTGGLVQDRITNVSGSSGYFMGGMVTYSNDSKVKFLGVKPESLAAHGAVSEVVAREMARGIREAMGTDIGVSTTGIAGPTGGTPEKPVGLIYIGLATADTVVARRFVFVQDRRLNKELGAQAALEMVRRYLLGIPIDNDPSSKKESG